jgi:hypothetical protein
VIGGENGVRAQREVKVPQHNRSGKKTKVKIKQSDQLIDPAQEAMEKQNGGSERFNRCTPFPAPSPLK